MGACNGNSADRDGNVVGVCISGVRREEAANMLVKDITGKCNCIRTNKLTKFVGVSLIDEFFEDTVIFSVPGPRQ